MVQTAACLQRRSSSRRLISHRQSRMIATEAWRVATQRHVAQRRRHLQDPATQLCKLPITPAVKPPRPLSKRILLTQLGSNRPLSSTGQHLDTSHLTFQGSSSAVGFQHHVSAASALLEASAHATCMLLRDKAAQTIRDERACTRKQRA